MRGAPVPALMVERSTKPLRRAPREGSLSDVEAEILHGRAVGVGKLTQGFREVQESDEDG